MEQTPERDTFVALHDVLETAAQRCLEAEAQLKVLAGQGSDPVFYAWEEIAVNEHELAMLLVDFARNAPDNLLATRFQYNPGEVMSAGASTPDEAVAALVNTNFRLTEHLRELALNIAPPELAEILDTLRREVESMGQTISMISVTMRDS